MSSHLKKFFPTLFLVFWIFYIYANEEPVNDLYHFNYYLANPAVAGANDCTYAMLGASFNWVGMEDAPMTQLLAVQTRLQHGVGLGGYVFNDRNGYVLQQGLQFTVAYHINLTENKYTFRTEKDRQLSFAVSGKVFNRSFSSDFIPQNPNDPAYFDMSPFSVFNTNAGIYYVSYGFFTGLSAYNLIPMKMWDSSIDNTEPYMPMTFRFLIGNKFNIDAESIEPSIMCKANVNGAIDLDLNLKYAHEFESDNNSAWCLQASYRSSFETNAIYSKKIFAMAGFTLNKFHFGYSFGLDLNRLIYHNYGTHQLMLGYTFCHVKRFCR